MRCVRFGNHLTPVASVVSLRAVDRVPNARVRRASNSVSKHSMHCAVARRASNSMPAGRPAREISHPIARDLQCILSICRTSRSAGRIGWSIAYACPRFIVGGQGWDVVRCRPAKRPHESSTNAGHAWANRTVGSICSARVRRSRSCRCVVTRMIRAVTEQNVNFTERYVPCHRTECKLHRTECKCHRTLCATSQNLCAMPQTAMYRKFCR